MKPSEIYDLQERAQQAEHDAHIAFEHAALRLWHHAPIGVLVEIDDDMASEPGASGFRRKTSFNYDPGDKDGHRFTSRRRTTSRRGRRARRKSREKEASHAQDIY